jgi:hypothetical protein
MQQLLQATNVATNVAGRTSGMKTCRIPTFSAFEYHVRSPDSAVMVLTLSSKLPKGIEEQTRKLFARHATSRILNQVVSLWRAFEGTRQRVVQASAR